MDEWRALVAAEQEVALRRAAVNSLPTRTEVLADAMSAGSTWDRAVAMTFLRLFPDDVPRVLDLLVDLSLSHGWAPDAWEAIRAGRSGIDAARLAEVVVGHLVDGDAEDYLRLADMLAHVEAWETLAEVLRRARSSGDPEIHAVARAFTESYGHVLPN